MRAAWLIAALVAAGPWVWLARAAEPPASSSTASSEQVAAWIADLDGPSFAVRETATRRLIEQGEAGIGPLSAIDASASLEQVQRTLQILSTLASDANGPASEAATEALRRLAGSADPRIARRAADACLAKQQLTIAKIEQLGGRVERAGDDPQGTAVTVFLGRRWQGGEIGILLLKGLPEVEAISFERTELADSALTQVAEIKQLKRLYLGNCQITGRGLDRLKPLEGLRFLSLRGLVLEPRAFELLAEFPHLTALGLDNTNASDADLARLAPLVELETLWLNSTKVTDAGLAHLKPLASLTRLELASTQVTGSGLAALEPLARLDFLTLENTPLDDAGAAMLGRLKQVKKLGLDRTKISDAGLAQLAALKNLEILWIDHCNVTDQGLESLTGLTALTLLHAEQTQITRAGAAKLQTTNRRLRVAD